jgi:hypothetical protein
MHFRYDDWEKPTRIRDTFDHISRAAERGSEKPELSRSQYLPGKQMTAEEFTAFQAKGGKIDYCFERADKQLVNDQRHEDRAKRHPLMDIVIDVLKGTALNISGGTERSSEASWPWSGTHADGSWRGCRP